MQGKLKANNYNDLLGPFGELPLSPLNMTANGSSPPSAHGEKKKSRIQLKEESRKKEAKNSSSNMTLQTL